MSISGGLNPKFYFQTQSFEIRTYVSNNSFNRLLYPKYNLLTVFCQYPLIDYTGKDTNCQFSFYTFQTRSLATHPPPQLTQPHHRPPDPALNRVQPVVAVGPMDPAGVGPVNKSCHASHFLTMKTTVLHAACVCSLSGTSLSCMTT